MDYGLCDAHDLFVDDSGERHEEILNKVEVLLVLNRENTLLNEGNKLRENILALESWNQVMVTSNSLEGVDWLQSDGLVLAGQVDTIVQEKDGVDEARGVILVEHVNQVAEEQTVSHFDEFAVVVQDLLVVVWEDLLDGLENVCVGSLWVQIAEKPDDDNNWLDNDVLFRMLDKGTFFDQISMSLLNVSGNGVEIQWLLTSLFADGHIERLDAEVARHGNSAIDVIAKPLKKFGSLSFDDVWLLLVASIQCQIHEFYWFVVHLLSLSFGGLDEIHGHVENQVGQKFEEYVLESFILGSDTQIFQRLDDKIWNCIFLEELLKIGPLPQKDERLDQNWYQIELTIDDLVLICFDETLASVIFLLEHKIDALQRFGFQLIDDVVQNLKASDLDDTVVIWWVGNLDVDAEYSDQDRGKSWALHEVVIAFMINAFWRRFLEHSKNHFDEAHHDINLLHDLVHDFVLACQLKLVLFQHIVELQNMIIEGNHLLFDYDVKLSHTDLLDNLQWFIFTKREHGVCKHKRAFQHIWVLSLRTINCLLLDLVCNIGNILEITFTEVLLILVEQHHWLESVENESFLLELNVLRLKAHKQKFDVSEGSLDIYALDIVVSCLDNQFIQLFAVDGKRHFHVLDLLVFTIQEEIDNRFRVIEIIFFSFKNRFMVNCWSEQKCQKRSRVFIHSRKIWLT